jgi:hypothetical protein
MLNTMLYQYSYVLLTTAHNFMFVVFLACIIRIFSAKQTPYSAYYVGLYACANSFYNGCPLLELQNYLARQFGGDQENIGAYNLIFGDAAIFGRVAVFIGGGLLLYYAYKSWQDAPAKVQWRNIFINHQSLTFSGQ